MPPIAAEGPSDATVSSGREPMLRIRGLGKTFPDGTRALDDVSLEVDQGEFVVVLGPSGSGKTTLLRSINGLIQPTAGSIFFNGQRVGRATIEETRRKIGTIFQHNNLVSNLSAINNTLTGLCAQHGLRASLFYIFKKEHKLAALECLERVGLLAKAYTRADRLSGGQQQRVGIARAIIKRPLLLLADEPISNLDPVIAFNILSLLKDINVAFNITVICNLHQVDLAMRFADRIVGLADGRLVFDRPVGEVDEAYIQSTYRQRGRDLYFGLGAGEDYVDSDAPLTV